jgi:hypothetical protein
MWLAYLLLFIALSPGILFTAPLGKKMGGKVGVAVVHAIIFVITVKLLHSVEWFEVSEGFQDSPLISTDSGSGGSGGVRVLGLPFCRTPNATTRERYATVSRTYIAVEDSLKAELQPYQDAINKAKSDIAQYEAPYHQQKNAEVLALRQALVAKEAELRASNPTLASLYATKLEANRIYAEELAVATTNAGSRRFIRQPQSFNSSRRADSAYTTALNPLIREFRLSTNNQIQSVTRGNDYRAYQRNRTDLYAARAEANRDYVNKRKMLLRDPVRADLVKAAALARYNYQNACRGNITIATSIPFTYSIFGVIF